MIRLYIDRPLSSNIELLLNSDSSHYLKNVLRLKQGDRLNVFNGISPFGYFSAQIKSVEKRTITLEIGEFVIQDTRSPLKICLYQGISKAEKMDFTIQKSVELGVSSIQPVWMEHTNIKLNDEKRLSKKLQHWQKIAYSAMEQSGQNALVKVDSPIDFQSACQLLEPSDLTIVLNPWAANTLADIDSLPSKAINIFIGPEGGISETEVNILSQYNSVDIQLGPRILRTETASLAIISILQSLWGDFK
ncbi:MAG: 16S rRNA (uracil(1498)-N(3))-methyltransferase [Gammaproteobacteria bacterium]|nr:16S rRNA (uracil(1498)-N(3))-methyltransferase [Gammaproteobacteria bacterium]